jgi:orotate phosphoribosyltransferase
MSESLYEIRRERLLALLRTLAYREGEITLASGKRSNFYIDCRQAVLTAEGHFLVGWLFYQTVLSDAPAARAVGGISVGADPLASATAFMSTFGPHPVNAFYIRKEPKGHGTGQWLEGTASLAPGMPVVVVEDVITTGGSTLRAIERARDWGLDVVHVVALVDRQEEGGAEAVAAEAPLTALFRREDFR